MIRKTNRVSYIAFCCTAVGCLVTASLLANAAGYSAMVHKAQIRLTELGYQVGPLDGLWGEKTAHAVELFQKSRNLPVTGELDEMTMEGLDLSLVVLGVSVRCDGVYAKPFNKGSSCSFLKFYGDGTLVGGAHGKPASQVKTFVGQSKGTYKIEGARISIQEKVPYGILYLDGAIVQNGKLLILNFRRDWNNETGQEKYEFLKIRGWSGCK